MALAPHRLFGTSEPKQETKLAKYGECFKITFSEYYLSIMIGTYLVPDSNKPKIKNAIYDPIRELNTDLIFDTNKYNIVIFMCDNGIVIVLF